MSLLSALIIAAIAAAASADPTSAGLKYHNTVRARHSAPAMSTNADIKSAAQQCADYYANQDQIDHTCPYKKSPAGKKYGENLFAASEGYASDADDAAEKASDSWYSEIKDYDFATGPRDDDNFFQVGHFTQVVWDKSVELGMAFATSSSGQQIVVGLYSPAGNMNAFNTWTAHVHAN